MSNQDMKFRITYDGSALKNHEMDVRDLAPALLHFSELIDETAKVIYGDKIKINLHVVGSFKPGSFGIDFVFVKNMMKTIFGDDVEQTKKVLEVIGLFGGMSGGLIKFIIWLKGKKIEKVEHYDRDKVSVTANHGSITIHNHVYTLYGNSKIMMNVSGLLKPLSTQGIDEFTVSTDKQNGLEIEAKVTKDDYHNFNLDKSDLIQIADDILDDLAFRIIKPSFDNGASKWQFSYQDTKFYASINDTFFLKKVNDRDVTFMDGDYLAVNARLKKFIARDNKQVKFEWEVLEVIDIRHGYQQPRLEIEDDE